MCECYMELKCFERKSTGCIEYDFNSVNSRNIKHLYL